MDANPVADRLPQLALFAALRWPELEAVAHTFEEEVFGAGQRVLRQGLTGAGFYVVLDGEASVLVGGKSPAWRGGCPARGLARGASPPLPRHPGPAAGAVPARAPGRDAADAPSRS